MSGCGGPGILSDRQAEYLEWVQVNKNKWVRESLYTSHLCRTVPAFEGDRVMDANKWMVQAILQYLCFASQPSDRVGLSSSIHLLCY